MDSRTVRAESKPRGRAGRLLAGALLLLGPAWPAQAALRVVATTPDVADMVRAIGAERVDVQTLAEGNQDPHRVPIKPSFVSKLNRADAVVVQGLGLEHAFLPALLDVARNRNILPGQPGYIDASLYVEPLQVPSSLSRAQGDLHPLGNPHFNLDPLNGKKMARAIAEGLERVDPQGTEAYERGLAGFLQQIDQRIDAWKTLAEPLRGRKVISNHIDLPYLAQRYGFEVVGTIEYKPGVPATPAHLEELIDLGRREKVDLVVHEISYDISLSENVAGKLGVPVASVSVMAGGLRPDTGYLDSIQANLESLVQALASAKQPPG
jgi:ABC-type Zn uptake system ZnuABC Zn-binding protein ZnuA